MRYSASDTGREVRRGIELVIRHDRSREAFTGAPRETMDQTAGQMRVQARLAHGAELGPAPRAELAAAETKMVQPDASSHAGTGSVVHAKLGLPNTGAESVKTPRAAEVRDHPCPPAGVGLDPNEARTCRGRRQAARTKHYLLKLSPSSEPCSSRTSARLQENRQGHFLVRVRGRARQ